MPERYVEAILKYVADRQYHPLKPRRLARQMGIAEADYSAFREAVKRLRDAGRVVLGARNALMLPEMSSRVVGFYQANRRGFGFVVPEEANAHGDLFIPEGSSGGAMTGDSVVARAYRQGRREGKQVFAGKIVEILQRGRNRFVGTLQQAQGAWFVLPEGRAATAPIVIPDVGEAGPKPGTKVVVEIVKYPQEGQLPSGVIVETLGEKGQIEVETLAVIRAHGLEEEFSQAAMDDARLAIEGFGAGADARENWTDMTVVTIDPPSARDFDDAISLRREGGGSVTLGVHIADVSHFVREGAALDIEARRRSTSTYFPRKVLPMLPEILSNGVCSLQQGQPRYCKSVLITYDAEANVTKTHFAETVISSTRRLTYQQAQEICDGKTGGYPRKVVELLQRLADLSRRIERRRRRAGMLHLDLPAVELVFDENDRVVDAVPEDDAYTHTMIEMFMVESNEAVASLLDRLKRHFLRRIHPAPDEPGSKQLTAFIRACGHKLPADISRGDLQMLLEKVKGRPESHAVNLAVLKTFQQAEYSPMRIGHFALASENYCHFTSPIRRYPDLTVHRLLGEYCRGELETRPPEDISAMVKLGEHCSAAERRSEAAERELREVLVLQLLETKVGESFDGVITGVTNFGLFVQSRQFGVEGLIRMDGLGDDWWDVNVRTGEIRGQRSGKKYRIGDRIVVRIVAVDVARRQLDLLPEGQPEDVPKKKTRTKPNKQTGGKVKPRKKNPRKR